MTQADNALAAEPTEKRRKPGDWWVGYAMIATAAIFVVLSFAYLFFASTTPKRSAVSLIKSQQAQVTEDALNSAVELSQMDSGFADGLRAHIGEARLLTAQDACKQVSREGFKFRTMLNCEVDVHFDSPIKTIITFDYWVDMEYTQWPLYVWRNFPVIEHGLTGPLAVETFGKR